MLRYWNRMLVARTYQYSRPEARKDFFGTKKKKHYNVDDDSDVEDQNEEENEDFDYDLCKYVKTHNLCPCYYISCFY